MKKIIIILLFLTFFLTPIYSFGETLPYEESQFEYSYSNRPEENAYYALCDVLSNICTVYHSIYQILTSLFGVFGIHLDSFSCVSCENMNYGESINNKTEIDPRKDWQSPTAEEEALEKPLIDPIDIMSIFGGGLLKSLFGGAEKIATDATEKAVYYYFKDPSGTITKSISEEGIKVSKGFFHTLGYEGKVFVSDIPPDKISKINLFSYGIKDADSFVKVAVKEGDLAIPAQTIYYGEKGARVIKDSSGLYKVGVNGEKYLTKDVVKEVGSLTMHEENMGSIVNNVLDAPRCLTRYWLLGGTFALDINGYLDK